MSRHNLAKKLAAAKNLIAFILAALMGGGASPYIFYALKYRVTPYTIAEATASGTANLAEYTIFPYELFYHLLGRLAEILGRRLGPKEIVQSIMPTLIHYPIPIFGGYGAASLDKGWVQDIPKLDSDFMEIYIQFPSFFLYTLAFYRFWTNRFLPVLYDYSIGTIHRLCRHENYFIQSELMSVRQEILIRLKRNLEMATPDLSQETIWDVPQDPSFPSIERFVAPFIFGVMLFVNFSGSWGNFRNTLKYIEAWRAFTAIVVIAILGLLFVDPVSRATTLLVKNPKKMLTQDPLKTLIAAFFIGFSWLTTPLSVGTTKESFHYSRLLAYLVSLTRGSVMMANSFSMATLAFICINSWRKNHPNNPYHKCVLWVEQRESEWEQLSPKDWLSGIFAYPDVTISTSAEAEIPLISEPLGSLSHQAFFKKIRDVDLKNLGFSEEAQQYIRALGGEHPNFKEIMKLDEHLTARKVWFQFFVNSFLFVLPVSLRYGMDLFSLGVTNNLFLEPLRDYSAVGAASVVAAIVTECVEKPTVKKSWVEKTWSVFRPVLPMVAGVLAQVSTRWIYENVFLQSPERAEDLSVATGAAAASFTMFGLYRCETSSEFSQLRKSHG